MGTYNFKVRYSNREFLTDAGYGRVAHLPFILDSRPGYHRDGSQYIMDRGLGIWVAGKPDIQGSPPTERSIASYAAWLCSFLEWADKKGVDLVTADYADHVHGRYQADLLSGVWGRDGRGLSEKTVNLYVDTAVDFLSWMAAKGKRPAFAVPVVTRTVTVESATGSAAQRSKTVQVRIGRVREPPSMLRMPRDSDVDQWLATVYGRKGQTFGLMCETVLDTAIRREEVACWRLDTLALNPDEWEIANPTAEAKDQLVKVALRYGTKGPSFGYDHGDKVGPQRVIRVPLRLANRLHAYRKQVRPPLLAKWVSQGRGAEEQRRRRDGEVHLFLTPNGTRETATRFYDAWKAGDLPFPAWAPHCGRHWWACSTLMQEVEATDAFIKANQTLPGVLVAALLSDIVDLKIRPQLGHVSRHTTNLYVQWVADQLGVALPERYQAEMLDAPLEAVS